MTRDETGMQLTPLAEDSIAVHEMFKAYVAAGFTEDQAMRLLVAHIAAAGTTNE